MFSVRITSPGLIVYPELVVRMGSKMGCVQMGCGGIKLIPHLSFNTNYNAKYMCNLTFSSSHILKKGNR